MGFTSRMRNRVPTQFLIKKESYTGWIVLAVLAIVMIQVIILAMHTFFRTDVINLSPMIMLFVTIFPVIFLYNILDQLPHWSIGEVFGIISVYCLVLIFFVYIAPTLMPDLFTGLSTSIKTTTASILGMP